MNALSIGQVAKQAGVGIETLRFYERKGLIKEPPRKASGYRQYPTETVQQVLFIKNAKELGFTLKEIQELLTLSKSPKAKAKHVKQQAQKKLDAIKEKIDVLKHMQRSLNKLIHQCEGGNLPLDECPILNAIKHGDE